MKKPSIAVVEPQMDNLFHAPFNAALLHAVVLGFPEVAISFRARAGHALVVREILQRHAPEIVKQVEWREIDGGAAGGMLSRWLENGRLFRTVLKANERVLFCSISRMQLLQLKRTMRDGDDVRAVLHGDLDRISQPVTERFPTSLFALQRVLAGRQPKGLRYVLLSESIKTHLPVRYADTMKSAGVIDHPYHFPAALPAPESPVVFGVFGNTGDGRLLEAVAREVRAEMPEVGFRLVGFLSGEDAVNRLQPMVEGAGVKPISADEFVRGAEAVTYTLWLSEPGSFKLRASGTFLDALAYAKPLIYTANPFIDSYYAEAPEIGVRCEELADVPRAAMEMARQHGAKRYEEMQRAMVALRERFTPEALALRLPTALGWD